jgi:hypothetical protein
MALNPYATEVRGALLERLPRLAPYMTEGDAGTLTVRVPHGNIPTGLVLTTEGDEVTIGFDRWHTHGELLGGASPREHLLAALDLVERILEDEVQLAISYIDGAFDDAWVVVDPAMEQKYAAPNEQLRIGTWSELDN